MKRGLVLSGGGAKGAFQAGALEILAGKGFTFDYVGGVSVGALNAMMVAAGEMERLYQLWKHLTKDQIYIKRSVPVLILNYFLHRLGLSKAPLGIYSNDPLFQLLRQEIKDIKLKMPLTVGRVDLMSGHYISNIDPDSPGFARQMLASTAIPVIWDPVQIDDSYFVDGGIRNITPIRDVMLKHPDQIVVITTEPREKPPSHQKINTIIDVAERSLSILLDEIFKGDLNTCLMTNKLAQQAAKKGVELQNEDGHTIHPIEIILIEPKRPIGNPLDFSRSRLDKLLEEGRKCASEVLKVQALEED